jgi:uncharacterized membrane protein
MKKVIDWVGQMSPVVRALVMSNLVSLLLFLVRVIATQSSTYWFLFWNLFLAWVPMLLVWLLKRSLRTQLWIQPLPVLLTVLWLGFLPNSFYIMSDLIHLESTGDIGVLYDAVFMLSFIWNGAVAGFLSMIWMHQEILKRRSSQFAGLVMTGVILLTSFAIYLGRSLRWNTWDVLVNPAGLLFDVSERVINPLTHAQYLTTTGTFFLLIGSMYYVVWTFVQQLSLPTKRRK